MTRVVLLLFALCLAANCVAAARLDLMPDEAFFWMCSQRLALSYVDHPPMTALLARGGAELFGTSPFGARALFVLAGALLPRAERRRASRSRRTTARSRSRSRSGSTSA